MDRKALGAKIRQERLQMNFTQEQLAESIGVSCTYIGLIERGERSVTLEKLVQISNILHVSVDYLLSDSVHNTDNADFSLLKKLWFQAGRHERTLILDIIKTILHHSGQ